MFIIIFASTDAPLLLLLIIVFFVNILSNSESKMYEIGTKIAVVCESQPFMRKIV